jgi:hypothetical protein
MQTKQAFHTTCRAIICSNADDYTKAIAQVGLGTWDTSAMGVIVCHLMQQEITGQVKRVLRRIANKIRN